MRSAYTFMVCLAAAALISFAPPAASAAKDTIATSPGTVSAISVPAVQLKHWKNSTIQERRAFLMGFVAMLEMEHAWQGKNELPISQSTVSTWVRGLSGVSIPEIDNAVNDYVVANPKAMEMTVIETLGRLYVRPKLSKNEREDAAKRYDVLKASFAQ
ncbi:exported hypothetical protein [uncultured delta proteobacterium]|uniref:Uncharacterized protein n=1 Tax=uncultured delta proteobacterium TaxID=34034 RepID=A0A212JJM6_9DELT|nr:exported hypothetical protein [uncultured delta proteobacterium]